MGISLRRTPSPSSRRASNQYSPNNSSSNHSRSNNNNCNSSSSSGTSSTSSTRKISRTRKPRSRSTSSSRNNYYLDNPYRQRQPVVMMVPNSLLPVTAYFPRDYIYEFEDEGYDSASSSTSESPVLALGWRPTQGTWEMEFMFGDMDEEFMQELTRESTPSSDDDDDVMMEMGTYASGSSEGATSMYDHQTAESRTSENGGGHDRQDRMGGRVVDEDYD